MSSNFPGSNKVKTVSEWLLLLFFMAILVVGASYVTFGGLTESDLEANWPQSGKDAVIREQIRMMRSHECSANMNDSETRTHGNLFPEFEKFCKSKAELKDWEISERDATGVFRCEGEKLIGEYAITVYREEDIFRGPNWCEYKFFPIEEDKGVGQNVEILHWGQ